MTTISLTLPDALAARLARRAEELGYPDAGAYLAALAELADPLNKPVFHSREELHAKLREALDDPEPATPMTADDWEAIRREGRALLAIRAGMSS